MSESNEIINKVLLATGSKITAEDISLIVYLANKKRKVVYSEYVAINTESRSCMELQEKGTAEFMLFGVDYEELDNCVGSFTTAIIKLEDGTVKNIPVENVRFI